MNKLAELRNIKHELRLSTPLATPAVHPSQAFTNRSGKTTEGLVKSSKMAPYFEVHSPRSSPFKTRFVVRGDGAGDVVVVVVGFSSEEFGAAFVVVVVVVVAGGILSWSYHSKSATTSHIQSSYSL